ncbi:MAG: ferritin [Verrucomicrobiae bacterium]|nr:ferritin [Verrucomicrobiae bacterium]
MSDSSKLIRQLRQAWRDEVGSARMYRELARREPNAERGKILDKLAEAEEKHARNWAARLKELNSDPGEYSETVIERTRRWAWLQSGTENAVRQMEAAEEEADALYDEMLVSAETDKDREQIREAQLEEKAHGKVLGEMFTPKLPSAQRKLDAILGAEKHVTGGGWIGQAIYGMNDGLGAAFGVVSGVAGATGVDAKFVLLSGIATAIASALSMGSGAYLATKSEREVYEAEVERERKEIEENPDEEREEMALFYQLKGFSAAEADKMARRLAEKPDQLLKTLAHEELGLSEKTFPNPWKSATSATVSTAFGAFIPVIPFFFLTGTPALVASFIISTVAHFAVGASKVIVTGRSWVKSGTEMTVVGLIAATITYCVGLLIAPVLH